MTGRTTAAGYGWTHQQERARWAPIVEAGRAICWRSRRRILPRQPWDMGHHDLDRSRYRGPDHRRCNRGTGSRWARRKARPARPKALSIFDTAKRPKPETRSLTRFCRT